MCRDILHTTLVNYTVQFSFHSCLLLYFYLHLLRGHNNILLNFYFSGGLEAMVRAFRMCVEIKVSIVRFFDLS